MAKVLKEAALTTRSARAKLPMTTDYPYYRSIDPDTHLSYRKSRRGGRWGVRWYRDGAYKREVIGTADDYIAADGTNVLDFDQAIRRAKAIVEQWDSEAKAANLGPALTVKAAIESYIGARNAREDAHLGHSGRKRDARSRLTRHVLSDPIADKNLHSLTASDLQSWSITTQTKMSGGNLRRLSNDFKAALNAAHRAHRARLPVELPMIFRDGLRLENVPPTNARQQVLPDAEVRRLITAAWDVDTTGGWQGDLAPLVVVLAATGARFSQLTRMLIADVQPEASRLMVPPSRKGGGADSPNGSPYASVKTFSQFLVRCWPVDEAPIIYSNAGDMCRPHRLFGYATGAGHGGALVNWGVIGMRSSQSRGCRQTPCPMR
jgi:hypothetical protein